MVPNPNQVAAAIQRNQNRKEFKRALKDNRRERAVRDSKQVCTYPQRLQRQSLKANHLQRKREDSEPGRSAEVLRPVRRKAGRRVYRSSKESDRAGFREEVGHEGDDPCWPN